ncbi:S-methyl-5'-thioadenosine phosphorylase [Cellulomonas sp. URHE0023]|uniref:S-methyl-5'-thioadenosine phosphorylase n=1 Tax=Cellulomonas sp. URHE0023 TaxID=1380354 RepID=UPI000480692D|nr:S-methyl-5'-thioadenosine phosphorylase [Cellulomonas sp. URHE0023]
MNASPIGIIGGSGLYELLVDPSRVTVTTPFGDPSDSIHVGRLGGRDVAFLPRHGADHRFPPHRVPYRANLWALRSLGVRRVLAPGAVGALRPDLAPGTLVVPDQIIDSTWGRDSTYYDAPGAVVHVGFADPYCPQGRTAVRSGPMPVVDGGTLVVIQGPRFSTRAESRRNAVAGGDVVGMTGMPETVLARELALCYTGLAVVTDADAGVEAAGAVSHQAVLEQFARSVAELRTVLTEVVAALPVDDECSCRHALDGLDLPFELPA